MFLRNIRAEHLGAMVKEYRAEHLGAMNHGSQMLCPIFLKCSDNYYNAVLYIHLYSYLI